MSVVAILLLLQAAATPAAAPAMAPAPKPEKKICKSSDVIGSRVQKRSVCMTKAEWEGVGRNARDLTRTMQDRLTGGAPR